MKYLGITRQKPNTEHTEESPSSDMDEDADDSSQGLSSDSLGLPNDVQELEQDKLSDLEPQDPQSSTKAYWGEEYLRRKNLQDSFLPELLELDQRSASCEEMLQKYPHLTSLSLQNILSSHVSEQKRAAYSSGDTRVLEMFGKGYLTPNTRELKLLKERPSMESLRCTEQSQVPCRLATSGVD